jgi:hypothetical protein
MSAIAQPVLKSIIWTDLNVIEPGGVGVSAGEGGVTLGGKVGVLIKGPNVNSMAGVGVKVVDWIGGSVLVGDSVLGDATLGVGVGVI